MLTSKTYLHSPMTLWGRHAKFYHVMMPFPNQSPPVPSIHITSLSPITHTHTHTHTHTLTTCVHSSPGVIAMQRASGDCGWSN
jgi:hypothetical protein